MEIQITQIQAPEMPLTNGTKRKRNSGARTTVRFIDDEYAHLVNDMQLTGVSIPVLLKRAYFKRPRLSPLMGIDDKKMLVGQIARIGNNVNQIARALNSGFREGFNDDIATIRRDLSTLVTFLTHKYGHGDDETQDID